MSWILRSSRIPWLGRLRPSCWGQSRARVLSLQITGERGAYFWATHGGAEPDLLVGGPGRESYDLGPKVEVVSILHLVERTARLAEELTA